LNALDKWRRHLIDRFSRCSAELTRECEIVLCHSVTYAGEPGEPNGRSI
jgi:hypothetical protein